MLRRIILAALLSTVALAAGCNSSSKSPREAALSQLSPEDRKLAEAQGYCAVTSEPLGDMGPPLKVVLGDKPVWICCQGCQKKAKANPEKTLAHAEELKAGVASKSKLRGVL